MKRTFIKKFQQAIASTDSSSFIMQFEGHYYYCYWNKAKWQYRRIELISTEPEEGNEKQ